MYIFPPSFGSTLDAYLLAAGWQSVLDIAVFEWRLDDWLTVYPLQGAAKDWLSTHSAALQAGIRAVAASIRQFKSSHPGVAVMLVTDLFVAPVSELKARVAGWAQQDLLVCIHAISFVHLPPVDFVDLYLDGIDAGVLSYPDRIPASHMY